MDQVRRDTALSARVHSRCRGGPCGRPLSPFRALARLRAIREAPLRRGTDVGARRRAFEGAGPYGEGRTSARNAGGASPSPTAGTRPWRVFGGGPKVAPTAGDGMLARIPRSADHWSAKNGTNRQREGSPSNARRYGLARARGRRCPGSAGDQRSPLRARDG